MGILVLITQQTSRFYEAKNSIIFAAALMIALNPKLLRFDIGFQLSFLATFGLIYIAPIIEERLKNLKEFLKLKESLITTLSAQLMVLPIILYNFKKISLVSIPTNVLILPTIPITMFFGFLTGILGIIWIKLGQISGLITWLLSEYQISISKILASIPFSSKNLSISWSLILLFYLATIFLVYKLSKAKN